MKTNLPPAPSPPAIASRWTVPLAGGCLVLALLAAYQNIFSAPFVFDDVGSIVKNPTIRHLWPLSGVLHPPTAAGATVGGRPLLNLSFAFNYALGGEAVAGYHAINLLIHIGAALLLFGLARRTLTRWRAMRPTPPRPGELGDASLAFAITALWALHPLQTESVTYTAQRAEALAGFFCLLTLYAFARGAETGAPRFWRAVSIVACLGGMATKEVMAAAPLLVLVYDRTFVAGSFRAAWRSRPWFYVALGATWLVLLGLVVTTGDRGGTAGFGTGVSPWTYALTQTRAVTHYLRLAVWPAPLTFDYGQNEVRDPGEVLLPLLVVMLLVGATIVGLIRRPALGFLGGFFFAVLAPSSSIVPVASQTMAEHRMYLPLAAAVALVVLGAHAWLGARIRIFVLIAIVGCAAGTWQRNVVYASELALWSDTVAHAPDNARAHSNLGNALLAAGRLSEATAHYETALQLRPDYADAHNNLGRALADSGRAAEAIPHYEAALRAQPRSVDVLTNLGSALARTGRVREAIATYQRALELEPEAIGARYNLGNAQLQLDDPAAAAASYEAVLRVAPAHVDARFNLAAALLRLGRPADALAHYEQILRLTPDDAATHAELANILAHLGRTDEAIAHYETALRLRPDFPVVRDALARVRAQAGSVPR